MMTLFDEQMLRISWKEWNKKNRQISALKGVITKLRNKIQELEDKGKRKVSENG